MSETQEITQKTCSTVLSPNPGVTAPSRPSTNTSSQGAGGTSLGKCVLELWDICAGCPKQKFTKFHFYFKAGLGKSNKNRDLSQKTEQHLSLGRARLKHIPSGCHPYLLRAATMVSCHPFDLLPFPALSTDAALPHTAATEAREKMPREKPKEARRTQCLPQFPPLQPALVPKVDQETRGQLTQSSPHWTEPFPGAEDGVVMG